MYGGMSPKGKTIQLRKGKSGGQRKGVSASSDVSSTPGRGPHVPRLRLGHDTLLGLAQAQRRTLAFTGSAVVSGAAGIYAETSVILNGLFNVYTGGSPVGFAKYMAFYSKAFVLGARITVRGVSFVTTAPAVCGVTVTTNSTSLGSYTAAIDNGMCDWTLAYANPDRVTFNESVEISKFLYKPKVLDDPQLFNTSAANPTQLVVAHLWSQSLTATAVTLYFVFEVEQDVVFTDPIPFT
jgi:hypothetical protein